MPLNRDQHPSDGQPFVNVEGFTINRQQKRVNPEKHSGNPVRLDSPQDDTRVLAHNRKNSTDGQADATVGKQFALDDEEIHGNDLKIRVPTALPPKQDKSRIEKSQTPTTRPINAAMLQKVHLTQHSDNGNIFDQTESLDMSYGDVDYEENQTIKQKPQSRISQHGRESSRQFDRGNEGRSRASFSLLAIGKSDPNYDLNKNTGREILSKYEMATNYKADNHFTDQLNQPNEMGRRGSFGSDSVLPDTPSRSRSAPIHQDIAAPVAQRAVAFDSSPQFMNMSPVLQSEEMVRAQTPDALQSRPKSALSGTRGTTLVQRTQQRQPLPHSQLRESQMAPPARFQTAGDHNYSARTRGQKVSAPESDVPESSEDERPAHFEEKPIHAPGNSYVDKKLVHGRKRPHDEAHGLDYDQAGLSQTSLAELQGEPFIKDPRGDSGPQVDSIGYEMSLSQVFEKWSRMSDEVLRGVFQSQTDDEWAQTGQWFVNSFQTDLKELMDVRLERRKVAMNYEQQIRRRQREIEHYRAGLDKELRELQEGGIGLLKDRKMTAGSRSSTPMKPTRPH